MENDFPMSVLEGIGTALRRAIPLPGHDSEAKAERRQLRKIDLKQAVKR